jgi:hypothetical protein
MKNKINEMKGFYIILRKKKKDWYDNDYIITNEKNITMQNVSY